MLREARVDNIAEYQRPLLSKRPKASDVYVNRDGKENGPINHLLFVDRPRANSDGHPLAMLEAFSGEQPRDALYYHGNLRNRLNNLNGRVKTSHMFTGLR